jgi:branched-chain amino acid aminotransferase
MKNDTDAHVTISSWRRIDDNMIPARGKVAGAYVNSALIKSDAVAGGYDEALAMDGNGHISEGSAMNVFMLRDGVLITPPVTDNILEGITRRTVMELARSEMGLTVIERSIDRTELFIAEEFFMTGTAAAITAVTQIDHRLVGTGKMGPVTTRLRALYDDVIRGRNPKYMSWSVEV